MKLKLFLWVCVVSLPISAAAQTAVSTAPDAASKEDVKKLFDVMASREQMQKMMEQLFVQINAMNREQLKKRRPEITDEELVRFDRQSQDLIQRFPLEEMLDDMIPVYQRHFSKTDIHEVTAFYSSPTGQKFLREMPAVMAETMRAAYPRIQAMVDGSMKREDQKSDSQQK